MKFKVDREWLLERMPEANENQVEAFQERVAILVVELGMGEEEARIEALELL